MQNALSVSRQYFPMKQKRRIFLRMTKRLKQAKRRNMIYRPIS